MGEKIVSSNIQTTRQGTAKPSLKHTILHGYIAHFVLLALMWAAIAGDVWFCFNWLIAPALHIGTVDAKGALGLALVVIMFRLDLTSLPAWFNTDENIREAMATLVTLSIYFFIVAGIIHLIIR